MSVKKLIGWAIVAFIAWYLFTKPTGAAAAVHGAFGVLHTAGERVSTFFSSLN